MFKNALFIACVILTLGMISCGEVLEYDKNTQLDLDVDSIKRFLEQNNLNATDDGSGLYSTILSPGKSQDTIGDTDEIIVDYTGKLLNGIIIEEGDSVKLKYAGLIEGWKKGLKKIKPDSGIIRLIIPSTMAYTNKQVGVIPPNSNLDYLIKLRSVIRDTTETQTTN